MDEDRWLGIMATANEMLPDRPRDAEWSRRWFLLLREYDGDAVERAVMEAVKGAYGGLSGPDICRALGITAKVTDEHQYAIGAFDVLWSEAWRLRLSLGWSRPPADLTRWQAWLVEHLGGWVEMGLIEPREKTTHYAQARNAFEARVLSARRADGSVLALSARDVVLTPGQAALIAPPREMAQLPAGEPEPESGVDAPDGLLEKMRLLGANMDADRAVREAELQKAREEGLRRVEAVRLKAAEPAGGAGAS